MVDFYETGLQNKRGELFIGEVPVQTLADKFGTPLYVINEQRLRANYQRLDSAIREFYPNVHLYYAMKANSNLNVLRILRNEGASADTVSISEVLTAKSAGFRSDQILFTGTNISNEELEKLVREDILLNLDSKSQFSRLLKIKIPNSLSFRINPDFGAGHHSHVITGGKDSKFGIWTEEATELYKSARCAGIRKFGIHMHVGSNILKVSDFNKAVSKFMDIVGKIKESTGVEFEFIDLGGGLGVPYLPEQKELDLNEFAESVCSVFIKKLDQFSLGRPTLHFEPGRYLVADACVLLTKVNSIKSNKYKNFAGVDAGMNTLIRPAMYGSYHHILVNKKLNQKSTEKYDIVGPICESGDFLAKDRKLPRLDEGDLLAVLTTGAYGYTMSSTYNLRERPAEVLVSGSKYELIREREHLDLSSGQKFAQWLQ